VHASITDDVRGLPRQLARTRRFSLGVPHRFTVAADGTRVLFLRSGSGSDPVAGLWVFEDGRERLLAAPVLSILDYTSDRAARVVAFTLDGELWLLHPDADGAAGPVRVPTPGPVVQPYVSPDGTMIAYVTGGALHVTTPVGDDRRLACPETSDVSYGLAEPVTAESMGREQGLWWAPDSSALLVARVDVTDVRRWWIADAADPGTPPRSVRYPTAGTTNADVSLHILAMDGGRVGVPWDRRAFEYLASAGWDAHGPLIAVQSRDQRTVRTLAVDPATGATRVLHEQRDPAWVELVPGTPRRTAAGALVHTRDDRDTRRLVVGAEAVTPVGLQVREVLGTDDNGGGNGSDGVLFTGGEEPTETHVWRWTAGEGCVRLSQGPGVHTAVAAGGTLVLAGQVAHRSYATVLRHAAPAARVAVPADLAGLAGLAVLAERPTVVPRPAFLRLGERQLRSCLYLPSWHEPGSGRLPVLLDPYGGQHRQVAGRALGWWACVSQWFAEHGFAVLVTDGRGSPGRGPAWERAIHGDILTAALTDQVDALHAAAAHCTDLDLERVAIRGWSFGGFLAAGAVLRRPDVFRAAVAGAPPTDQRLYQAHWKERYLGHPAHAPENYDRCDLVADAHLLRRPLLLMHGTADDNVFVSHTLRLSAALLAAGRRHQVMLLPGAGHAAMGHPVAEHLLAHQLDFLTEAVGGVRAVGAARP
jgi:dipeptidyl-peptidase 4